MNLNTHAMKQEYNLKPSNIIHYSVLNLVQRLTAKLKYFSDAILLKFSNKKEKSVKKDRIHPFKMRKRNNPLLYGGLVSKLYQENINLMKLRNDLEEYQ